jgi:pyruvate kinase
MRRTKIVCTLGPAGDSDAICRKLLRAGMNVARLNFSHGDHAFHLRAIRRVRANAARMNMPVAILQDLAGPKIRIGRVSGGKIRLAPGQTVTLTPRPIVGDEKTISVNRRSFTRWVKKAHTILLGDGEIELEATRVAGDRVDCRVVVGGELGSHKGIHFPHSRLDLPALTSRDRRDLEFGVEHGVDLVALSFVTGADDILRARRALRKAGGSAPIIAKIERHEALDHLDSILEVVDGIMVARGDLGLSIPPEKVPWVQKTIIGKANRLGKPVITATQMLKSMVDYHRPTRAEVTDIANAVLDGTDALMLSEETATGKYPVDAVETMSRIALETERNLSPRIDLKGIRSNIPGAISYAAISLAQNLDVKAFLVPTTSGSTARMIARFRPRQPILALSPRPDTISFLCLVWGVFPIRARGYRSTDAMIELAQKNARALGLVKRGDLVAITAGLPLHEPGTTNLITVKIID